MPAITWPQAFVLSAALAGVVFLAYTHNPELAGMLSTASSLVMLYQEKPGTNTTLPPNPPVGQ